jgi:hypothetical protein
MIKVYCDTGGYLKKLKELESKGLISVHQFKYENRNNKIQSEVIPSDLSYGDTLNYSYGELEKTIITYGDMERKSGKLEAILSIVGNENKDDARHIDAAYLTGCSVFLTTDKNDIWSNRVKLKELLGISVFLPKLEWECFETLVRESCLS